jgi:hypothetical protein
MAFGAASSDLAARRKSCGGKRFGNRMRARKKIFSRD